MSKLTLGTVFMATALSATLLTAGRGEATPLGAAAANVRFASESISPVTSVWWRVHRFHRPLFFHHRAFFLRHRVFALHRPFLFHRFHRCHWC